MIVCVFVYAMAGMRAPFVAGGTGALSWVFMRHVKKPKSLTAIIKRVCGRRRSLEGGPRDAGNARLGHRRVAVRIRLAHVRERGGAGA
jgi:hypothetical protein